MTTPTTGDVHSDKPMHGSECQCKDCKAANMKKSTMFDIFKSSDEERMVYGWASVISEDGEAVVDTQEHIIEADELVKSTTAFMKDVRRAMLMHERNEDKQIEDHMTRGTVVHSFPLTSEIMKSLGIDSDREGWIVGVHIEDDNTWDGVKDGTYRAFSIGGGAMEVEVEDDEPPVAKRHVRKVESEVLPPVADHNGQNGHGSAISGGIHLNIHLPPVNIDKIEPAIINMPAVTIPDISPQVTVNVPEQPAPIVNVDVHQAPVMAEKPHKTVTTVLEKDSMGGMKKFETVKVPLEE